MTGTSRAQGRVAGIRYGSAACTAIVLRCLGVAACGPDRVINITVWGG